jgi:hypothetical protein
MRIAHSMGRKAQSASDQDTDAICSCVVHARAHTHTHKRTHAHSHTHGSGHTIFACTVSTYLFTIMPARNTQNIQTHTDTH